jgi:hypothetical protein
MRLLSIVGAAAALTVYSPWWCVMVMVMVVCLCYERQKESRLIANIQQTKLCFKWCVRT